MFWGDSLEDEDGFGVFVERLLEQIGVVAVVAVAVVVIVIGLVAVIVTVVFVPGVGTGMSIRSKVSGGLLG